MSSWLAEYWWLIWALAAVAGLVAYRMHGRGGNEAVLRRITYALFPYSDPVNRPLPQLSAPSVILIGGGLVLVMLLKLVFLQTR